MSPTVTPAEQLLGFLAVIAAVATAAALLLLFGITFIATVVRRQRDEEDPS